MGYRMLTSEGRGGLAASRLVCDLVQALKADDVGGWLNGCTIERINPCAGPGRDSRRRSQNRVV